ncbi:hypothetical protein C8J56DRAFT_954462 [Mycena floridula]|nr:hypothetical protein C8J56DRAFT_954462 [Mycena floridula]
MAFIILLLLFALCCTAQDFTQCVGSDLDWYTSVVGETPCATYQRLRQTCNSQYKLGALSVQTPGDRCDDQVGTCCCNYASFVLSMLCLNCQQDINSPSGIDAGAGAYDLYLGGHAHDFCPVTNNTLTPSILSATCNKGIKVLANFPFWSTGDCTFSREAITTTFNANLTGAFQPCSPSLFTSTSSAAISSFATGAPGGTSTASSSDTSPSSAQVTSKSTLNSGAIAGIAVGVIVLVFLTIVLILMLCRHRRNSPHVLVPFSPNMSNMATPGSTSWAIDTTNRQPQSLHQFGPSVSTQSFHQHGLSVSTATGPSVSSGGRPIPDDYPNSPPGYNQYTH